MESMIRRLSQSINKGRLREIDVGDEVKVAQINEEEILVDFPSRRRASVGQEEKGCDTRVPLPQWNAGISVLSLGTLESSDQEDDDCAFLGFPEGGRKLSLCREKPPISAMGSISHDDATLSRMPLPTAIFFPTTSIPNTKEAKPELMDVTEATERSSSFSHLQTATTMEPHQEVMQEEEEEHETENAGLEQELAFEKPSNWINDDDDDCDSCDSEEARQNIIRMARERAAAEAPPVAPEVVALEVVASPHRPQRRRSSAHSHRSVARRRSSNDSNNENANPFATGFDFAAKSPVSRAVRRQSLTTTTYAFEANAVHPQPRSRARRASMSHTDHASRVDFETGLKAFGAKSHDIHLLLH